MSRPHPMPRSLLSLSTCCLAVLALSSGLIADAPRGARAQDVATPAQADGAKPSDSPKLSESAKTPEGDKAKDDSKSDGKTAGTTAETSKAESKPGAAGKDDAAEKKDAAGKAAADKKDGGGKKEAADGKAKAAPSGGVDDSICLMIESAAKGNGLPVEFFARIIWQESRFRSDAVGPMTRNGNRAQGIAQFMPGTAAERGLLDPFNPVQALPKSAEFLAALHQQFGNLGLAAAAYNAGPRRVREWLDGTGGMPQETRNYVAAVTGLSVDDWATARTKPDAAKNAPTLQGCGALVAMLRRSPSPFYEALHNRVALVAAKPWGVQLAADFSRDRALSNYARVMGQYRSVLGQRDPSLQSTLLRSRGTRAFYQVRVGADTRADAETICGQIRRVGGACMVLRNERGRT